MTFVCAGCGCRAERGVRVGVCDDPACCCHDLTAAEGVEPAAPYIAPSGDPFKLPG
jgi:hypothetical protein